MNEKEAKLNVDKVQFERYKKEKVFGDANCNVRVNEPDDAALEVSEISETKSQGPVTSSTSLSSSSQILSQTSADLMDLATATSDLPAILEDRMRETAKLLIGVTE